MLCVILIPQTPLHKAIIGVAMLVSLYKQFPIVSMEFLKALIRCKTEINIVKMVYSGTSDKGPSEMGTTSLQRTLVAAPC